MEVSEKLKLNCFAVTFKALILTIYDAHLDDCVCFPLLV